MKSLKKLEENKNFQTNFILAEIINLNHPRGEIHTNKNGALPYTPRKGYIYVFI